ncbi:sensor histidine kinase [Roseiterribacter gracilis]|uniref:histidine kinase n=1 Tax=Roseiterribacter gracilis TaxID=2812848 RepID=A0A8S8XEP2_9PROT|nr:two-component system sensor histidine kinase/response regulator [Rhodospirillales bacterium TMPK1]
MTSAAARILFVDDDDALRVLAQRHLTRAGYEVEIANDGEAALELLRARPFDVVVVDHYMPTMDGLATLKAVRAVPGAPPVIYLTGSDESRIAVAALKAGASDYLVKHVGPDFFPLLLASIETCLGAEQLRRAKNAADAANAVLVERQRLMLREMNHRIANSLAMAQSLLRLQEREIQDPTVRTALVQAQERVTAIAQVHRYLYAHDDFESVPLEDYLPRLLTDLAGALDRGTGERLTVQIDPLRLPPDTAIQLGLLAAELVTNALKYAYPDGNGEVRVTLRVDEDLVKLIVEDDGVGFSSDGPARGTGLGTRLIRAFSTALGAELSTTTGPTGTCVTLAFDNSAKLSAGVAA